MNQRARQVIALALLGAGFGALLLAPPPPVRFGWLRWTLLGAVVGLVLVPAVRDRAMSLLERVRRPDPRTRARTALVIAVLSGIYLVCTAALQGRDFFPKTYDDQAYLLQMRLLATGRLWTEAHPDHLRDFFDSVHVITTPVYASAYFPGTALMYVPTIWLGLPTWLLPVIAAAACAGLVYRIVAELVDGLAGALAALVLVSSSWFRLLSILLMSQVPALLLGLLMVWAWLRWRRAMREGPEPAQPIAQPTPDAQTTRREPCPPVRALAWPWLAAIGVFAGWMAITRPVDAICYALPVGVAIAAELSRKREPARGWGIVLATIVLAASPFLALQLAFNKGVTGRFSQTPFGMYIDRDQPGTGFGFQDYDPQRRPQSILPQKQALYDEFVAPRVRRHTPGQLWGNWFGREDDPQEVLRDGYARFVLDATLPSRPLLVLLPVGLLALAGDRRRWTLFATLPLFLGLYAFYSFFLEHYAVVVAPAVAMTLVLALPALESAWPRWRAAIASGLTMFVVAACLLALPEVDRLLGSPGGQAVSDEPFRSTLMRFLRQDLKAATDGKAIVLIRWGPGALGGRTAEAPVYNTDSAWPDDARIIYANDLGPQRNVELIRYYAQLDPERKVILFDRTQLDTESGEPVRELGTAGELLRAIDGH